MASSHLLCNTSHFHPSCNLSSKSNVSSFKPSGPFSFCQQLQSPKNLVIKATGKQVELVYDPDGRINKLADEVDKQAPVSRLTLFSPCKVISLGDVIKFSLSPSKSIDRLSTNVSGVLLTEDNLIIKALNHYRKKTGTDNFFWIHLDKKVPAGAGLGGGSINAATALWAANQFSGCLATEKELQEWSSEIGSDIPFFLSHGTACCTWRGEVYMICSLSSQRQDSLIRIMFLSRSQFQTEGNDSIMDVTEFFLTLLREPIPLYLLLCYDS